MSNETKLSEKDKEEIIKQSVEEACKKFQEDEEILNKLAEKFKKDKEKQLPVTAKELDEKLMEFKTELLKEAKKETEAMTKKTENSLSKTYKQEFKATEKNIHNINDKRQKAIKEKIQTEKDNLNNYINKAIQSKIDDDPNIQKALNAQKELKSSREYWQSLRPILVAFSIFLPILTIFLLVIIYRNAVIPINHFDHNPSDFANTFRLLNLVLTVIVGAGIFQIVSSFFVGKEADKKIKELEAKIDKLIDRTNKKVNKIDTTLARTEDKVNQTITKAEERVDKRLGESQEVRQEIRENMTNAEKRLDSIIKDVQSSINKTDDKVSETLGRTEDRMDRMFGKVEKIEGEALRTKQEIDSIYDECRNTKKRMQKIDAGIDKAEESISILKAGEKEIEKSHQVLTVYNSFIKHNEACEAYEDIILKVQQTQTDMFNKHIDYPLLAEYLSPEGLTKIPELRNNLNQTKKILNNMIAGKKASQEYYKEFQEKIEEYKIEKLTKEHESKKKEYNNLIKKIQSTTNNINAFNKDIKEKPHSPTIKTWKTKLAEAEIQKGELKKDLSKVKDEIEILNTKINQTNSRINEISTNINNIEDQITDYQNMQRKIKHPLFELLFMLPKTGYTSLEVEADTIINDNKHNKEIKSKAVFIKLISKINEAPDEKSRIKLIKFHSISIFHEKTILEAWENHDPSKNPSPTP